MFYSNALNLIQVGGGTQVKQGDLGSKFSYKLADEKEQELDVFDKEVAHINLVLVDKIVFTTTATVDNSTVTFNIDKAIPVGLYFLEIKIRDYIFPSDKQTIIFVQSGAVAYDLKDLVPNYDVNMTLKGILSDLSQKGIDINELKTKMSAIYNNALADHAEITTARGTHPNLKSRLDEADNKQQQTSEQLVQKVGLGKKAEMEDLSDTVISAMTGGATVNMLSIPQDRSVTPIKRADSVIPVVKDLNNYTSVAEGTFFYVPKVEPLQKGLVNFVGNFKGGTVRLFLVEKDGLKFNVIDKKTVAVTPGINTIFTKFIANGTGNEYLGIIGEIYFNRTGGEGMYENRTPSNDFETITTIVDPAGSTFDFAIYPTYEHQEIIDKINNKLDINTEKLVYSAPSKTVTKDFNSYTVTADTRTYVPNNVLGIGNVVVHFKSINQTGTFYILERTGSSFTVKKALSVSLVDGVNTVDMGYYNDGSVETYFGFRAQSYYKRTGGKGMFETGATLNEGHSYQLNNSTNVEFDFAYYIEYTGQTIELKEALKDKLDIITKKLVYSAPSKTVTKDFNSYTVTAQNRTYVPNNVLGVGNVVVHFKSINTTGTFYILERTGSSFTVKKALSVSLVDGINIVDMGYYNDGTVETYFGFSAQSYYKRTGGKGMFETGAILNEGHSYQLHDTTNVEFDFAYYIEYTGQTIELKEALKDLYSNVEDIRKEIGAQIGLKLQLTDYSLPKYKEISDPVGYVGRWFDATVNDVQCKCTINAGSEFYFKVSGTAHVDLLFEPNHGTQTPYFAYSVDGGPFVRQLITVPRLPELTTDEHLIRVVIDGLTEYENKWHGEKGIAFNRVEVDGGGTVKGILPLNRVGEFYGDSITEGVRVLSMDANANGNSASGAYPFVACDKLNAISHRVGFGLTGATQGGSGGVPKFSEVIDNMTQNRKVPYHIPDFIVINHGTNDGDADSATFKANYNSALERLRIKYSGVPIFTMIPFNQRHAQDIRDCVADKSYCYLIETANWNVTFTDGGHPDVNGGIVAGTKLAEQIEATLGKSFFVV